MIKQELLIFEPQKGKKRMLEEDIPICLIEKITKLTKEGYIMKTNDNKSAKNETKNEKSNWQK